MDPDIAIRVEDISKAYHLFKSDADRLRQLFSRKPLYTEFWALRNISFSIPKGSVVGIVGRNGSGKSTILQIIAGTLSATSGRCETNGRIAALLELGSGFNPDFTGRENVYLSGSIFGINAAEMDRRFANIAMFADIGDFIDQPVKTYSSGMFARLAFAVNINVDADILVIDEALSVGDHFFQAKCMSAINELMRRGTTILLVSHSAAMIKALCQSAILFNNGQIVMQGSCDEVMDRYMAISLESEMQAQEKYRNANSVLQQATPDDGLHYHALLQPPFVKRITDYFGNRKAEFVEAALFQNGRESVTLEARTPCKMVAWLRVNEDINTYSEIGVVFRTFEGIELFALNSFFASKNIPPVKKGSLLRIEFLFELTLGPGKYSVTLGMRAPVQGEYVHKVFNSVIFDVVNTTARPIPLIFDVPFTMAIEVEKE